MSEREARARVMVIDDDKNFLELMRLWLSPRYEVLCARSGADMMEDLDAFQPDLVVLDVHMPDPNGFALCRRLRAHPRHGGVPVLFLTGSQEDPDFQEHLASKGNGYLMKPVEERDVLSAARDMISRWPARSMIP